MKLTLYHVLTLCFVNIRLSVSRIYLPAYSRNVQEQGCKYTNKQKCLIEVYCNIVYDLNMNEMTDHRGCESENIYWNGGYLLPMHVILKNIMDPEITFGNEGMNKAILSIDLSGNNYEISPMLRDFENLNFLNISYNDLTIANLYNQYELKSLTGIDFSHNRISDVATSDNWYILNTLINITLSYNRIKKLNDNVFIDFNNLRYLDLSHNQIADINLHTFEGLTQLLFLQLSHNNIIEINSSLFRFTELEELYLNNNNIEKLLFSDFESLHNLKILDLSYNSIILIEENILQNIQFLKKIDINNNLLSNISRNMLSHNILLENVNLSCNKLTKLPLGIFKGKNVSIFAIENNYLKGAVRQGMFEGLQLNSVLNLNNQALTNIEPYAFFGLEKLTSLILSSNVIETISDTSFYSLINLKLLDLTNNRIKTINFDKVNLVNLKVLLLRSNNMIQISSNQLKSLHRLEILDLSYNNISQIETKSFTSLLNINNFQISRNPLVGQLESNTFEGLILVPTLDLSYTLLDVVQNNSLDGMINLIELNISYSKLNEVQYNAFLNTGNIKILDLSHNRIKSFHINTTHLLSLDQLLLDNNLIKSLTSDFVKGMIYLNKISVSHNSIIHVSDDSLNDQKDLSYLDLSSNHNLYCNFSVLKHAKHLKTLILSNTLSNISFSDYKDVPITFLEIEYSNIPDLVNLELNHLKNIVQLRLSHNNLSQLEVGSFSNLSEVSEIDISFNKISVIQPGVFKENPLLNKINISHNALLEIGYGIFRSLVNLKTLDVSFNLISSLESETFYEVESLTELIVDHNRLSNISLEVLRNTNISVLSIGDNPISCKALSNLVKYKHSKLSITALRYVDEVEHNSFGITCDIKNHKSEFSNVPRSDNYNENTLLDIRDILSDMNLKQSSMTSSNLNKTVNLARIESIQENNTKEIIEMKNYVSKVHDETVATNKLLERILKMIVATDSTDRQILYKNNITSENFLDYLSGLRKDIKNEMTIEKEIILAEVDSKLLKLHKNFDTTTTIAITTVPPMKSESLLSTTTETKSPIFVETCVGLILIILVCIVVRKVYKSKIYMLRGRSMSTRQISDAMETSNV